jgi:rhamnogalacturonyl hydrolase YesR
LVEPDWLGDRLHLIYRDDFEPGVVVATVEDLDNPHWKKRLLIDGEMGGWEPTFDTEQWNRLKQAQLFLQRPVQIDGDDFQALDVGPGSLALLIWSPNWERHQNLKPVPSDDSPANPDRPLSATQVKDITRRTALWQWAHLPDGPDYGLTSWTLAPLYKGSLAVNSIVPTAGLEQKVYAQAQQAGWRPGERIYDADDHCVMQPYLRLYETYGDERMIAASRERLDYILSHPPGTRLDWGSDRARDRWSWSDALFMGPMSWLLMYRVTGEESYLEFMNREWWATTKRLYRPEIGLYFRDESYLDVRERNGATIHWARGTGWSFAGLAQVLEHFPAEHPDYERYVRQFREMASAFQAAQQQDGLWRPGLLDPQTHGAKETSGSAFAVFALAWGINHGLLDEAGYLPSVIRGWNALSDCVSEEGKLEHVQPIGAAPYGFDPRNSEPFATGAFLMAASEVFELADSASRDRAIAASGNHLPIDP